MRKIIVTAFTVALALFACGHSPTRAAGNPNITDLPLNKYVNFAGVLTRIDKIETVAQGDGRPILQKAGGPDERGYIIVTVTMQNPSSKDDLSVPGNMLGFELADGSQIDETGADAFVLVPSLNDPPDTLHPKQHIQVAYLLKNWNGSPITKMFLRKNSGNEYNDAGYLYGRFQIPQGYVKALDPVPLPSPSPEIIL